MHARPVEGNVQYDSFMFPTKIKPQALLLFLFKHFLAQPLICTCVFLYLFLLLTDKRLKSPSLRSSRNLYWESAKLRLHAVLWEVRGGTRDCLCPASRISLGAEPHALWMVVWRIHGLQSWEGLGGAGRRCLRGHLRLGWPPSWRNWIAVKLVRIMKNNHSESNHLGLKFLIPHFFPADYLSSIYLSIHVSSVYLSLSSILLSIITYLYL